MKVDDSDPRPAYVQVADGLRTSIEDGRIGPGERLPPGRELAAQFGVAVMTIQKALDVLRREGLVVSQQGRGVFVAATSRQAGGDELATLQATVEDLARRVTELENRVGGASLGPSTQ